MATTEPRLPSSDEPGPQGPATRPQAVTTVRRRRSRLRYLIGILGPGLVTGAADDDPSGIATYSQTGAQFGYGQLWTSLWMLPLMTAVQSTWMFATDLFAAGSSPDVPSGAPEAVARRGRARATLLLPAVLRLPAGVILRGLSDSPLGGSTFGSPQSQAGQ